MNTLSQVKQLYESSTLLTDEDIKELAKDFVEDDRNLFENKKDAEAFVRSSVAKDMKVYAINIDKTFLKQMNVIFKSILDRFNHLQSSSFKANQASSAAFVAAEDGLKEVKALKESVSELKKLLYVNSAVTAATLILLIVTQLL